MEVHPQAADRAEKLLRLHYEQSTALADHDLSTAGAVFDPGAASVVCPACGCTFAPTVAQCPECGLSF